MKYIYIALALASVLMPQYVHAEADAILGVDSVTGVPSVLTPAEAGTLIGVGGQGLDANFDATNGNIITGADESRKLYVYRTTGNGVAIYYHSSGKLIIKCVVATVEGDCDVYDEIASGKKRGFKDSSGTVKFEWTESTGKISAVTFNTEDSGISATIQEEAHWAVAGCNNATARSVFDLPTANAPAPTCDTGSNTQKGYLAFDATTDESFQDHWILPTGFTGAIDVHFRWKAAATTGSVAWCAQLVRVADGSTSDPAFPAQATGNCVSDTAKGTTLQENAATITGVTCSSCAAGDHVYVRISRDPDETSTRTDTMTGDALLLSYGRTWRVTK